MKKDEAAHNPFGDATAGDPIPKDEPPIEPITYESLDVWSVVATTRPPEQPLARLWIQIDRLPYIFASEDGARRCMGELRRYHGARYTFRVVRLAMGLTELNQTDSPAVTRE